MSDLNELKKRVADYAVDHFVQSDMVVGLGSGSTAVWAVRRIGELLKQGKLHHILGIASSQWIEDEARQCGIPIRILNEHPNIHVTIDGADEIDPQLNLIKGGGGALLREKIVAQASQREVIIADDSKLSTQLGERWAVPIEVIAFGWRSHIPYLESLGATVQLRQQNDGTPFLTDQGNLILDCRFGVIPDPVTLANQIKQRTGIVEHGLFIDMATDVLIISKTQGITHLKK
jgi:ribose 5-phosphate isomerase A